jgi:hypothetical protein
MEWLKDRYTLLLIYTKGGSGMESHTNMNPTNKRVLLVVTDDFFFLLGNILFSTWPLLGCLISSSMEGGGFII